jgi:hypothetical protein
MVRHLDLQLGGPYRSRVAIRAQYFHRVSRRCLRQELVVVPVQAGAPDDARGHLLDVLLAVENADDLVRGPHEPCMRIEERIAPAAM